MKPFAIALLLSPAGLAAQPAAPPPETAAAAAAPARTGAYRLVLDPSGDKSMESGVALVSGLSELTYRGFNELADLSGLHRRWYLRPLALTAVMMGLPSPGNFLHEYYGHGAALREYGFEADAQYEWGWFLGAEGRAASMDIQNNGSYEANQRWLAGGMEASQLYLLEHEKEIYRSGRMTLLAAKPLFAAMGDLSYVQDGLDADKLFESNDGSAWLRNFKAHHGNSQGLAADYADRSRKVLDKARTLDPALYWALVTAAHYLWTGDDGFYAPALPLAGVRLGFSVKANLSPLGPENYYYVFAARKGRLLAAYLRDGVSPYGDVTGYGAEFGPVKLPGLSLTPSYDKWDLPEPGHPQLYNSRSGWRAGLKLDAPVYGALGLTGKASYKTRGFLLGQPAGEGYYGYAGISLTF